MSPGPKATLSQMVTVALRPDVHIVEGNMAPSDFALLRQWMDLNRDVLVRFWEGDIEYTEDALGEIRPI